MNESRRWCVMTGRLRAARPVRNRRSFVCIFLSAYKAFMSSLPAISTLLVDRSIRRFYVFCRGFESTRLCSEFLVGDAANNGAFYTPDFSEVSIVGCRLSVVGCRLSVVGCRLSVVGCRLSVVRSEFVSDTPHSALRTQRCSPHSFLPEPAQRPSRSCCPVCVGCVQGSQPMLV